jgi:SAM-dependent methyltransferase
VPQRHTSILVSVLLAGALLSGPSLAAAPADPLERGLCVSAGLEAQVGVDQESLIRENRMEIGRGLVSYWRLLGTRFLRAALSLPPSGQWLDQGAGSAKAMRQLFSLLSRRAEGTPRMTALAVTKPSGGALGRFEAREGAGKFRYEENTLEKAAAAHQGEMGLVTDVFGPISYVHDLRAALLQSLSLLRPGGSFFGILGIQDSTAYRERMYMASDPRSMGYGPKAPEPAVKQLFKIIDTQGREIEPAEWIRAGRGFAVRQARGFHPVFFGDLTFRMELERTGSELWLPPLEEVSFDPGSPPIRVYRWRR